MRLCNNVKEDAWMAPKSRQYDAKKWKTYMIVDSRVDDTDLDALSVELKRVMDLLDASQLMAIRRWR